MPVIKEDNDVRIEYTIPKNVDERIPDYFYFAMAGELCCVFGPQIFQQIDGVEYDEEGNRLAPIDDADYMYYDLCSSTGGWNAAFKATCEKLDMGWLLDYYDTLEWYDSVILDGVIEKRIIEKVVEEETSGSNPYYEHLVMRDIQKRKWVECKWDEKR